MSYYDTLNIQKDASEQEIKKAFKKLALKHHPDRGGDKEKFQEIQLAYDTLVDQERREEYNHSLNGHRPSIFDMFFDRRANHRQQVQRGEDVKFELFVELEHSFMGSTKKIQITRNIVCSVCEGMGTPLQEHKKKCIDCDGTGRISILKHAGMMQIIQQQPCHKCSQRGYIISPEHHCTNCKGNCTAKQVQQVDVQLRKGCRDGEIIVFSGLADELPNVIPGDLLIIIRIKTHSRFTRKGDDIYMTKELTLYEALKGYDFLIKQLDGTNLRVQHHGITQPDTTTAIDNKGMPIVNSSERGKLWINFKVKLPENIPDNIIDMLNKYK